MTRWTLNLAVAASILVGAAGDASAEPVKIRAGWVVAPASLVPVLFAKQGLARHQGKSYVLEPVYFSASPAQITAMSVGELEIAAAMVDLLEDSLRAVRWYLPPTGPRRSTSLPASSSSLRPGSRAGSSPGTTSTGTPTGW
jgi:hypothetical protein